MLIDELDKEELRNLLVKNWMTHDGAWFLNTYLQFGIKKANKLNKRAIRTLSSFEISRIKEKLGLANKTISNYDELQQFVNNAFSVLKGDFMNFNYSFPGENRIHWDMGKCFAYEGMKKLGVEKEYECGVIYRVSCWLKELGLNHSIEPRIKKCLKTTKGECSGEIIISF
ncbi:MAG: hypothetical protein EU547_01755 [Promethearchaeota archaeon]|nr:MAG: hypothetical protein EU547_01755 [Candidatus Lokiarchaeota archaeon]